MLKSLKKSLMKIIPQWSKNTAFIILGFILGIGGVAYANPGHIVQKSLNVVGVETKTDLPDGNNKIPAEKEKPADSSKPGEPQSSTTQNTSNHSNGSTPSSSTSTSNPNSSGNTSNSNSNNNTPDPTPAPDMSLKGIEGLVATVHVGQAIYVPAVTPSEATFSVQWRVRTGTNTSTGDQIYENIPGATTNPYYPSSTYLNKWITCVITGTNGWTGSLPCPTDAQVTN